MAREIILQIDSEVQMTTSSREAGQEGDHRFTNFRVTKPSFLNGYECRVEYQIGTFRSHEIVDNDTFSLPSSITKSGALLIQLVYTDVNNEIGGKTNTLRLTIGSSINAIDETDPEFQDSLAQLANSSLARTAYNGRLFTSYNRAGELQDSFPIVAVNDHNEAINRDLPNQHPANAIAFSDGDSFQDKYDSGQLRGQPGIDGADGRDGIDGAQGPPGIPGANGTNGRDGNDGQDGLSAYEIARQNGFTGTPTEWLESLIGEDGLSAYELAVEQGFVGTIEEWLESLVGPMGPQGEPVAVLYVGTAENPVMASELPSGFCGLVGVVKCNPDGALYTFTSARYGIVNRGTIYTYFNNFDTDSWYRHAFILSGNTAVSIVTVTGYQIVNINAAQTIAGLKTFTTLPQSSSEPKLNTELVPMFYVDGEIAELRTDITSLQAEATAKWETLNRTEAKSLSNETAIAALLARIEALEAGG